MSKYLNGELIRIEPGREGSPVCHVVWDSYAQREVRIYNVRLIAAAPDLLAFVKEWLAMFTAAGLTDSPIEAEARALIAKAEGA